MPPPQHHDHRQGFIYAGAAYLIWGFLPLYMKLLSHIPAWEVVPHRIIWSLPLAAAVVWAMGLMTELWAAIRNRRMLALSLLTAAIIGLNWGIYVWAINAGRTLETAMGYYINPLFSVFLAAVLLGERLRPVQWIAVAFAATAVVILSWEAGGLPWVSVGITLTWGLYAFCKRTLPIGATPGFLLEVIILTIPSLLLCVYFEWAGYGHFMTAGWQDQVLLMGTGVLTAFPLMLYALGAKLLRLSTIAIMQYSAPTIVFLIAVFVFNEPFSTTKLLAFSLIWTALAIYSWSLLRTGRG